jgi:hypothetical protein
MFGDLRLSKNIVTPSWGFSKFLGFRTCNAQISKNKCFSDDLISIAKDWI